jgi:hypothetical protein
MITTIDSFSCLSGEGNFPNRLTGLVKRAVRKTSGLSDKFIFDLPGLQSQHEIP